MNTDRQTLETITKIYRHHIAPDTRLTLGYSMNRYKVIADKVCLTENKSFNLCCQICLATKKCYQISKTNEIR